MVRVDEPRARLAWQRLPWCGAQIGQWCGMIGDRCLARGVAGNSKRDSRRVERAEPAGPCAEQDLDGAMAGEVFCCCPNYRPRLSSRCPAAMRTAPPCFRYGDCARLGHAQGCRLHVPEACAMTGAAVPMQCQRAACQGRSACEGFPASVLTTVARRQWSTRGLAMAELLHAVRTAEATVAVFCSLP